MRYIYTKTWKNEKSGGLDEGIEEEVEFLNFGQGGLTITNMPWASIWCIVGATFNFGNFVIKSKLNLHNLAKST